MHTISEKRCAKCQQVKSRDCFHKDASKSDGLNSNCKECRKGLMQNYRHANSLKIQGVVNSWRRANPDKAAIHVKRWAEKHPEAYREIMTHKNKMRHARKKGAVGTYTTSEWKELCLHYNNRCLCCGAVDKPLTADHIVPLVKGGSNRITNIQPLCRSCNSRKHTDETDYR